MLEVRRCLLKSGTPSENCSYTPYTLRICMGTACYVKGAQNLYDYAVENAPDNFTIEAVRCFGACGVAPAGMMSDNGTVYPRVTTTVIDDIFSQYGVYC